MDVTRDGCDAYVALPAAPGGRGILVLHEAFGLTDDIRRITDGLAGHGYVAVAPAMLRRGCLLRTLRSESRNHLLDGWRHYLREEHAVRKDAVIGFCLGGAFALAYAAAGPDEPLAAVAPNYGFVPRDLSRLCPVVGSYGAEGKRLVPQAERLDRELSALGVDRDVKIYPGAGHSFMNQHQGGVASLAARLGPIGYRAEDAWRRIHSFLDKHMA